MNYTKRYVILPIPKQDIFELYIDYDLSIELIFCVKYDEYRYPDIISIEI